MPFRGKTAGCPRRAHHPLPQGIFQRAERLLPPTPLMRHVVAALAIAAAVRLFRHQTTMDPGRRAPLLGRGRFVGHQNLIDDRLHLIQLGGRWRQVYPCGSGSRSTY